MKEKVNKNRHLKKWYSLLTASEKRRFKECIFSEIFIDEKTSLKKKYRWDNTLSGKSSIDAIIREKIVEIAKYFDKTIDKTTLFQDYELTKIKV